ncbi:hypothetical protein JTE90_010129 [Oedothorax gibbosus]|uniref:Uncharacterized protein n=1 Tax=Oedothorax gibbosus TaxID=931172 RepID=A0AAV6TJJ3_9ARAC|nr:hypothetical protein JTE90_010129 [Oedothorax gibbosus]
MSIQSKKTNDCDKSHKNNFFPVINETGGIFWLLELKREKRSTKVRTQPPRLENVSNGSQCLENNTSRIKGCSYSCDGDSRSLEERQIYPEKKEAPSLQEYLDICVKEN